MRVESMVAQQAVLAQEVRQRTRPAASERASTSPDTTPAASFSRSAEAASSGLPAEVADRLASLFADDPGLAEAVSAHLPAARQASAKDLAAYAQGFGPHRSHRLVDAVG